MPLFEVLIILNPYQKKNGSCLDYVTLLGKWINNGHQTYINLTFICDSLSVALGQGYSILQKLWTRPRALCAPNDEIILIYYHLGPNIWKLSKLLMADPHLLCQMHFSLISALFSIPASQVPQPPWWTMCF